MQRKNLVKLVMFITLLIIATLFIIGLTGCTTVVQSDTEKDIAGQIDIGNKLAESQPTPKDVEYSLERYNLIKRTYWVNGMREKALALPCPVAKPLGYIILFTESGNVIGVFTVDGKVSSLKSYLTPSYWYDNVASTGEGYDEEIELPDVDGCYGSNVDGIFFFTTDGKYIEWTGTYLYSDIPFSVDDTLLGGY